MMINWHLAQLEADRIDALRKEAVLVLPKIFWPILRWRGDRWAS